MTQTLAIALFLALMAACQRMLPSAQVITPETVQPPAIHQRWKPSIRPIREREEQRRILESIEDRLRRFEEDISRTRRDLDKPPLGTNKP